MAEQMYTPYGFRDFLFEDSWQRAALYSRLHAVFKQYGYRDVETPIVEYLQVFDKERGSISPLDMYKFVDRDGEMLALRPDMTPALARMAAFYYKTDDLPLRVASHGATFRYNSRYSAKQRQLTQTGIELYGNGTIYEDAEVLAAAVDALKASEVESFRIAVGYADLTEQILEGFQVPEMERTEWLEQIESKNQMALEQKAAKLELSSMQQELLRLVTDAGDKTLLHTGVVLAEQLELAKVAAYFKTLETLSDLLDQYGVSSHVIFDPGMHPELGYYTGVIFQGYAEGSAQPVLDGGRYDALLQQFHTDWKAVGFGVYEDSLLEALRAQKHRFKTVPYLLIASQNAEASGVIGMTRELRDAGIPVVQMIGLEDLDAAKEYGEGHGCEYIAWCSGKEVRVISLDGQIEIQETAAQAVTAIIKIYQGEALV